MPRHTLNAFYGGLKRSGPERAYYFYGSEDVLKDEAVADVLAEVLDESLKDFNLDQLTASHVDPAAVADVCNTLPMMAERRAVVIRGVEAWKRKTRSKQALVSYLDDPAEETVLILVQSAADEKPDKALSQGAYAVDFEPLSSDETVRWLRREADRQGVTFGPGAEGHLLDTVGVDLATLRSELGKLSGLASGAPVTVEQVENLVGVRRGETVYDWRDAVFADQTGRAVSLIEPVLNQSGTNGVRLVTALGTALVGLGLARAHYDDGKRAGSLHKAITSSLKVARPFGFSWGSEAAKWAAWAPAWPMTRIRAAIDEAREADERLKDTRLSSEAGVITDLVMRLALGRKVTIT